MNKELTEILANYGFLAALTYLDETQLKGLETELGAYFEKQLKEKP